MRRGMAWVAVLALAMAACGGGDSDGGDGGGTEAPPAGDATAGEQVFTSTCSSCHGPEAEGLEGLGPALVDNTFIAGLTDAELVAFLEVGRSAGDPDNTTGVDMPPKGGNPALTEEDLLDVTAYLRTIN